MIGYPDAPAIDAMLAAATLNRADVDVTADDGVRHQMWVVDDEPTIGALTKAFNALPAIYIADGHHRSAAACRVAQGRGGSTGSHGYFLSVIFPHHQMTILDYNRVVKDLNGRSPEQLLAALRERFDVGASGPAGAPRRIGRVRHVPRGSLVPADARSEARAATNDPIGRLPVTLLSRNVLEPLFGIADQRTDKRIDFVGGGRGLEGLEKRVSSGEMAAAFALYPTQMTDLMAVADAGLIMPPKSTWFEPKLADGMVNHVLD